MNHNKLQCEEQIAGLESIKKDIWKHNYVNTFWPRLLYLARLGLLKEKELRKEKSKPILKDQQQLSQEN